MNTKIELETAVIAAKKNLSDAETALEAFLDLPENNVFDDLAKACRAIERKLEDKAFQACEGANNFGMNQYSQIFIVGDKRYLGVSNFEYNRHDKTYYYIDGSKFSYSEITA